MKIISSRLPVVKPSQYWPELFRIYVVVNLMMSPLFNAGDPLMFDETLTVLLKLTPEEDLEVMMMGGGYDSTDFNLVKSCLKKVGGEYEKELKRWYIPLESVEVLLEQINKVADVNLKGWNCSTLDEFRVKCDAIVKERYKPELKRATVRRLFQPDLMKFPPLKGIPPFEEFQKIDIQRALNQNRFLFNWEMGLGKSYATVALFDHLRHYGLIDKGVLLTTGIGTFNLKNEFLKFSKVLTEDDIVVFRDTADARKYGFKKLIDKDSPHKLFIMTYSVLKSMDSDFYKEKTGKKSTKRSKNKPSIPFDAWSDKPLVLFLDESHSLGNPASIQSRCVEAHKQYFEYIYEFTGTFADKYEKMYEQMKVLDVALVGGKNFNSWVLDYGDIGTKWSEYAVNPKAWRLDKLGDLNDTLVKVYSAKRVMNECLDLPMDYEVPTFNLSMGKKHRELYKFFIQSELTKLQEEAKEQGKSMMSVVLSQFAWLQSACENPKVLENTKRFDEFPPSLKKLIQDFNYEKDNEKVSLMDEIILDRVDENGEKGILWCTHPATINVLAAHYKKYSPTVVTSETEDKFGAVEAFKKSSTSKLLITSVFVLNTSVTVTEAKFNLYVERPFNYIIYSQSRGRIHRPGKTDPSRTYQMVFDNSTDALLDANLRMKGDLIMRLLSKDFFTEPEWKGIFNFKFGSDFV